MRIPYYQVDAFTDRVFSGNPAGVCLLPAWLPDSVLQAIARENCLSETAFVVRRDDRCELRWFTPAVEIDLCGHATLASAFVLFFECGHEGNTVRFQTNSGQLTAVRDGELITLDFPAFRPERADAPAALVDGLGWVPHEVWKTRDYLAVFANEDEIRGLKPELPQLATLDCLGILVTAPGKECDAVCRFFAPAAGIPEDPVTGSAQCTLVPYWSERLGKKRLHIHQLSPRGGELWCEDRGDRVGIGGTAVLYSRSEIQVPV